MQIKLIMERWTIHPVLRLFAICGAIALTVVLLPAQSARGEFDDAGWDMVWNDEFDGTTIDTSKWRVEDAFLVKNQELQYYAPDDVYLENGNLILRSQARQYWGWDTWNWRWFDYTSGLVETKGHFNRTYGRVEIRAKLPKTQGIWPAHWMLPSSNSWPPELDIMEMLGHEPNTVYTTHHWGNWPNVQSLGSSYEGPDYSAGFHTFALEWFPGRLDWYIDDALVFTSISSGIPNEPFYIILNTAVGGIWPGNPNGTTVFPQYHTIDYVRVYELIGAGAPLVEMADVTEDSAVADGSIDPGEYATSTTGVNSGLFDRIGNESVFAVDSSVDGRINFGFDGKNAWPTSASFGTVIYVDSKSGGFTSTKNLHDTGDVYRRLASGQGTSGQTADLYFAPGFAADYAVVLTASEARIFALSTSSHTLINGATLGAAHDMFGGEEVTYAIDANDSSMREFEARLSHFGTSPGASINLLGTMLLNGDTAYRTNEFIGASTGNAWDLANPAASATTIKSGDYLRFSTALMKGDANGDSLVTTQDIGVLLDCLQGPGVPPALAEPTPCLRAMDMDNDGDVDLSDYAQVTAVME
ncbi:MAG: family 16 glycosylhydrolase [Phycisphaerales bacterium]|nr:family 16 glycosylhydrolase [Phycisphaerales bacterium]